MSLRTSASVRARQSPGDASPSTAEPEAAGPAASPAFFTAGPFAVDADFFDVSLIIASTPVRLC
jgi:hypothetical protein